MTHRSRFNPLLLGTASVALLCASAAASAAGPGFYVAGTFGQSTADISSSDKNALDQTLIATWGDLGYDVVSGRSDLDKKSSGYELAVGYQFSPYLAVEAAYIDLGEAKYEFDGRLDDGTGPVDSDADIDVGVKGPALSLVGIWPVNEKISLDARAGALFGKSRAKIELEIDDVSEWTSEKDSKTSLLFGMGASWAYTEQLSFRIGYTHFADAVFDEYSVGRFSLGVKFAF